MWTFYSQVPLSIWEERDELYGNTVDAVGQTSAAVV